MQVKLLDYGVPSEMQPTEGGLAALAVGPKTLRRCGRLDAACMARKRAGTEFHGRRRYAVITRAL